MSALRGKDNGGLNRSVGIPLRCFIFEDQVGPHAATSEIFDTSLPASALRPHLMPGSRRDSHKISWQFLRPAATMAFGLDSVVKLPGQPFLSLGIASVPLKIVRRGYTGS